LTHSEGSIPLSETRNYVLRVMENSLVYQHRFGDGPSEVAKSASRIGAGDERGAGAVRTA
jgi:hypothetical protein